MAVLVKVVDVLLAELLSTIISISGILSETLVANVAVVLQQATSINIMVALKFCAHARGVRSSS
jgi:hypothetical protein